MKNWDDVDDDDDLKRRLNDDACSNKSPLRIATTTTTIEDLTDALLMEILIRLPVKSVHQSQSVSKRWLTITSHPWFARCFARHQIATMSPPLQFQFTFVNEFPKLDHKKENRLSSCPNMFGPRGFSLSFLPFCDDHDEESPVRVVASSNDLLLCQESPVRSISQRIYYICNPFTRRWVELPPALHDGYEGLVIEFVCNSYYNIITDNTENEKGYRVIDTPYRYRVIRARSPSTCVLGLEIFSSETGEWSELEVSLGPRSFRFAYDEGDGGSCFSNGRFHWMCQSKKCVLAYDPFDNNVGMIDRPVELMGVKDVKLGVCRGRLRLFKSYGLSESGHDGSLLKVWEVDDYSAGRWVKVHDLRLESVMGTSDLYFVLLEHMRSLKRMGISIAFHPYDGDIVYMGYFFCFLCCNMRHKRFERIFKASEDDLTISSKVFSLVQQWWPTQVLTMLPLR